MLHGLFRAFGDGGWPMWPILVLGLVGMGVAATFARRRERWLLGCVRWLSVALIVSACFGFCVDLQAVMRYSSAGLQSMQAASGGVPLDLRMHVVLEGIGESLNCLSSAFLYAAMTALLVALGCWRSRAEAV
jgi:hypothetical protein